MELKNSFSFRSVSKMIYIKLFSPLRPDKVNTYVVMRGETRRRKLPHRYQYYAYNFLRTAAILNCSWYDNTFFIFILYQQTARADRVHNGCY